MHMYLMVFVATFLCIGLRVAQTRNIMGEHYKSIFLVSTLIDVSYVVNVTYIISDGWDVFPPMALGGAVGSVTFTYLHKRIYS